jgi:hypothetical protein
MKILINEGQLRIISESYVNMDNVKSIYNLLIDAVKGRGTKKNQVLFALRKLRNVYEFDALTKMFVDKKTEYSSFDEMVNEEFDRTDYRYVNDIKRILEKEVGDIVVKFETGKNYFNETFFTEKFVTQINIDPNLLKKIQNYNKKGKAAKFEDCEFSQDWEIQLPRAKKYWKEWVLHPTTLKKMVQSYKMDESFIKQKISNYIDIINAIEIIYLNEPNKTYFAYVYGQEKIIYVNCGLWDSDTYGTLIHEIQHILYSFFPINPAIKIEGSFVNSQTQKLNASSTIGKFPRGGKINHSDRTIRLVQFSSAIKKDFPNVDNKTIDLVRDYWLSELEDERDNESYICQKTEKMSNIMSMRKTFNVGPSDKITLDMIKPYVFGDEFNVDVFWFLLCWAKNGFVGLKETINKVNSLAIKNRDKSETMA